MILPYASLTVWCSREFSAKQKIGVNEKIRIIQSEFVSLNIHKRIFAIDSNFHNFRSKEYCVDYSE